MPSRRSPPCSASCPGATTWRCRRAIWASSRRPSTPTLAAFLDRAADAVEAGCDLDAIAAAAAPVAAPGLPPARLPPLGQRIAVARDAAFGFAYWHLMQDWRAAGAEILPFSPLADQPPDAAADAVFLPGGYPELHAGRLAAAPGFRSGMRAAAARGAAIYGECGGYMVLGDGLVDAAGARHAMLGLLRLETSFDQPRRVLGYRRLAPLAGPWPAPLAGHEFHYARTLRAEGRAALCGTRCGGHGSRPHGARRRPDRRLVRPCHRAAAAPHDAGGLAEREPR